MIQGTFISVLLFVNYVKGGLILNPESDNVNRNIRSAYNYNHPPSAEYFSVPVAVFYEDSNREQKSVEVKVNTPKTSNDVTTLETEFTEPYITTLNPDLQDIKVTFGAEPETASITTLLTESTTQKLEISSKVPIDSELNTIVRHDNKIKSKIAVPKDGFIIPVAVVYDDEPENLKKRKPQVSISKKRPIIRQQRNKYTEVKRNEKVEANTTNENLSNVNIKTGTFPKRTQDREPIVPIIQLENYVYSHSGDFHYSYEGGDGTKAFERGELRSNKAGEAVEGSFSYIGKDGNDYSLTYTADENGYRPVGAHLPTPPPIPPAIARALKYLATKPTPESITESY